MKTLTLFTSLVAWASASPIATSSLRSRQSSTDKVGYLNAFFFGAEPKVYFDLSNGNDPLSFSILNNGDPILTATSGTGGVRDPTLVPAGGADAGKKYYIVGTDLDIGKTDWNTAQRNGSLSIFVWESTNLVDWSTERLVKVEDDSAGMVWAPEALWDDERGAYMVHWASKFYAEDDPGHVGPPSNTVMRYCYTKDFVEFSPPATYIDYAPWDVIDLNILPLGGSSYGRFLKNESSPRIFYEVTDGGLFGEWTRAGGSDTIIAAGAEGPASYFDNEDSSVAYVLLDFYGSDGYRPYTNTDLTTNDWVQADRTNFPTLRRHGSVIGVTADQYDGLREAYGTSV